MAPFLCAAGHSRARRQAAGGDIEILRAFQKRYFASTKGLNFDFAGSDGQRFADWKTANGQTTDLDDTDKDGLNNVLEYTLFGNPASASQSPLPSGSVETFGAESFLTLTVRVSRGADDVVLLPERSTDLTAWDGTAASIVFVSATADAAGGTACQWRPAIPWNGDQREYLHLRVQLR